MADDTIGRALLALKRRSRLSLSEIARRAGYKTPSSVQAFFADDYNPPHLAPNVAQKLAQAFAGTGDPIIEYHEVAALGYPSSERAQAISVLARKPEPGMRSEVAPIDRDLPTLRGQPKDVPVYGTALGADLVVGDDGVVQVEQTVVEMGNVIAHVRRPPGLDGVKDVYGLFVVGSSMEPRFRPGDPIFVDARRPPSIGDDVVVQLVDDGEPDEHRPVTIGLVKTLKRRTSTEVTLEQYSPPLEFTVPVTRIAHIHRVIPWREAFGM